MGPIEQQATGGRPLLADARRQAILGRLRAAGSVTVAELEQDFGVSSMTARRDLAGLERQGLARRTHGGAMLPSIAGHEDSFESRMQLETDAKRVLAQAAAAAVSEHETVLLDSSSTVFHVARALLERAIPLTLITNSLPVMELVGTHPSEGVELIGVGGQLRRLTRSFVGPYAVQTARGHFADRLFFSVKGITGDGTLTDADTLEAEVKRAMVAHAAESVLLIDQSKLTQRGLAVITPMAAVTSVLAYGVDPQEVGRLRQHGPAVEVVG